MKPSFLAGALACAALACSPPPVTNPDTGGTDASTDGPSTAGLPGETYCTGLPAPTRCPLGYRASCGVCVQVPQDAMNDRLRRTSCAELREPEYCDHANPPTAPNLSCFTGFDPANPPQGEAEQTVTVWGVVDVFGTGGDADDVNVQIFEVGADGAPGAMVGQATARVSVYSEEDVELNSDGTERQRRRLGGFKIENVRTEHPYIIRTQGDPSTFGHAIYDYTLAIRNRDIAMPDARAASALGITGMAVRIRPRTLANSDWTTIPSTAALPSGIPAGHGVIAGEVHDCDDVRLSNATVYTQPAPNYEDTVYFSNNDTHPLPDTSRNGHGTQLLGLYAILDVNPGPVRVAAIGYSPSGELVHVGSYAARVFPDSVTVVTLRGLRPWQVMRR
jgi:hypothetical protein